MKKGYSLNLVNKTLTITKAFEEKVISGEGTEYNTYKRLMADFPGLTVIRKTHKTPAKYKTKSGEVFHCNQFKNLKYENMEAFMSGLPNGEVYAAEYLFLREHAGKVQTNAYTLVRRWFVKQFPEFRTTPLFYIRNTPELVKAETVIEEVMTERQEQEEKEAA